MKFDINKFNFWLGTICLCAVVIAESDLRDARNEMIQAKEDVIEALEKHRPEHTHVYHDGSARWETIPLDK